MISRRSFGVVLALALAACEPRNPLIGRWTIDEREDQSQGGQLTIALLRATMGTIEFRDASMSLTGSAMILRDASWTVRYEVAGTRVTVFVPDGRGLVVEVEGDRATITFPGPLGDGFRPAPNMFPNPLGREFRLRFRRV